MTDTASSVRRPSWLLIVAIIVLSIAAWLGANAALAAVLGRGLIDPEAPTYAATAIWLPLLAGVVNLVALGGVGLALGLATRSITWASLGLTARPTLLWLGLVLGLTFGLLPVRIAIGVLYVYLTNDSSLDLRAQLIFPELSLQAFASAFIGVGILAPIGEEAFFRGVVYTLLRQRLDARWSIGLSSLAFALAHADSPPVIFTSLIIGLALAWAYEHTRSLWPGIFIHMLNNGLVVILGFGGMALLKWLEGQGITP